MDAGELLGPSQEPSQEQMPQARIGLHQEKTVDVKQLACLRIALHR